VRYATLEVVERLVELEEQVLPLRGLLERALPVLLSSAGVSTGALLVYKPDLERLVLVAQQGLSEAGISVLREISPGGMTGWEIPLHALLNRKAYIIDHIAEHPFVPRLVPVEKLGQVTNLAMVPLYRASTPTGVIILIADRGRPLEERHVLSLVLPLALLAVSIDQDRRAGGAASDSEAPCAQELPRAPLAVSHLVEEGEAQAQAQKLKEEAGAALAELEAVREQLVETRAELEAERRRSAAAAAARERALESAEERDAELEELRARVKAAEAECSQFRQRLAASDTEREGLERQLNLAKQQLGHSRAKLAQAEEELSAKRSALERALEQADAAKCEAQSARQKIEDLAGRAQREVAELKETLESERREARQKLEALARTEEELKKQAQARARVEERLASLEKEISSRREQEQAARRELEAARKEMEAREKKAAQAIGRLKGQLADQNARACALSSTLEAERKEKEEALCRLEAQKREAEEKLSRALSDKDKQERELRAKVAELERFSHTLARTREELARTKEALASERENHEALAARLSRGEGAAIESEARLREEAAAAAEKRAELEASVRELSQRCDELAHRLRSAGEKEEMAREQAVRLEQRVAELTEAVASAERRHRQAQVALNDAQAGADAYRLKLEEVTRALASEADERKAVAARAEAELAAQKRHTEALAREVESMRQELGRQGEVREKLEEELKALGEKLAGERSVVHRLRQAYTESEKLRIRTAEELSASESARKTLERRSAEQAARLATVDAEMAQARNCVARLEERLRVLEQAGAKSQEEGLRWQAALSQLNAALSEARAQLAAKAAEAKSHAKSAEAAEQKIRELRALAEAAEKAAAQEKSQREALEARLKALTGEYEAWARSRSGWKLEREEAPVEIRSFRAGKRQVAAATKAREDAAAAPPKLSAEDRSEITVIDEDGLDTGAIVSALGRLGMEVKTVKRAIEEEPKSAVALVNLMAAQAKPLEALLALGERAPHVATVAYIRDPKNNRGFPLGAAAAMDATAPGERVADVVGRLCRNAKRVMTVSDDIDAMIACKNALTRADYAMSMACDARQGGDLLELVRPDVIIVDTRMPDGGTARFLESLRAQGGQTSKALILLLAAQPEGGKGGASGLLGGLQLPEEFSFDALAEAVAAAETLKRGFSAAAQGAMHELGASASRLAG